MPKYCRNMYINYGIFYCLCNSLLLQKKRRKEYNFDPLLSTEKRLISIWRKIKTLFAISRVTLQHWVIHTICHSENVMYHCIHWWSYFCCDLSDQVIILVRRQAHILKKLLSEWSMSSKKWPMGWVSEWMEFILFRQTWRLWREIFYSPAANGGRPLPMGRAYWPNCI